MANRHFGNIADVFKHIAMAEILAGQKPHEYWESHAGRAINEESEQVALERLHGIHTFVQRAAHEPELNRSVYWGAVAGLLNGEKLTRCPGSSWLGMKLLPDARRFLFCDTDAASLLDIQRAAKDMRIVETRLQCVPDDGVLILRGAAVMLPEQWSDSTLALIDPFHVDSITDAGISSLELWGELVNRGFGSVLFYAFGDNTARESLQQKIAQVIDKGKLRSKRLHRFEGNLKQAPNAATPTTWGWGLLVGNVKDTAIEQVERKLKNLAGIYANLEIPGFGSGAISVTCMRV